VADVAAAGENTWESDGELVYAAASLHAEDNDFGQAGTVYRDVYADAAKQRFLQTLTGAVRGVQSAVSKERAIQYWTSMDVLLGAALRVELSAAAVLVE